MKEDKSELRKQLEEELENPFYEEFFLGKAALADRLSTSFQQNNTFLFSVVEWADTDNETTIRYEYYSTEITGILVAGTEKGICYIGFTETGKEEALDDLRKRFPDQELLHDPMEVFEQALLYFDDPYCSVPLIFHLKGTGFQLKIWERLLEIPYGELVTYTMLTGDPKSARAVGSAVGANPVSCLIPCHRVIRSDGSFEGYYWGTELKRLLLYMEVKNKLKKKDTTKKKE